MDIAFVEVHVASTGADTNPGTQAAPVRTIAKALMLLPVQCKTACKIFLDDVGPFVFPDALPSVSLQLIGMCSPPAYDQVG